MSVTRYKRGNCIRLKSEVYEEINGVDTLTDPDGGVAIYVYDESGTALVDGAMMGTDVTGKYYYDWQTDSSDTLGMCTVEARATSGAKVSIEEDSQAFEVYE